MQGDYMALRFKVADVVLGRGKVKEGLRDGRIVLKLDQQGVGSFVRFDDGTLLDPDEVGFLELTLQSEHIQHLWYLPGSVRNQTGKRLEGESVP
jgi:hypothetical protein